MARLIYREVDERNGTAMHVYSNGSVWQFARFPGVVFANRMTRGYLMRVVQFAPHPCWGWNDPSF